jgi:hypothetical protein
MKAVFALLLKFILALMAVPVILYGSIKFLEWDLKYAYSHLLRKPAAKVVPVQVTH